MPELITAAYTWGRFMEARDPSTIYGLLVIGVVGGLIAALVTVFKKTAAPYSAPAYALFEGLFLGGISATLEVQFPGIVIQAVGLTFGTLFCLLAAYRSSVRPSVPPSARPCPLQGNSRCRNVLFSVHGNRISGTALCCGRSSHLARA